MDNEPPSTVLRQAPSSESEAFTVMIAILAISGGLSVMIGVSLRGAH